MRLAGSIRRFIPELKVNDVKLKDWFGKGDSGLSKWAKQNFDVVNKTVQRGIFEQLDTDTIASQIIQESKLASLRAPRLQAIQQQHGFIGKRRRWPGRQ